MSHIKKYNEANYPFRFLLTCITMNVTFFIIKDIHKRRTRVTALSKAFLQEQYISQYYHMVFPRQINPQSIIQDLQLTEFQPDRHADVKCGERKKNIYLFSWSTEK